MHETGIENGHIVTVGAYVLAAGRYLFAIGPHHARPVLAVYRLGGHRADDESPWACATREVFEEAGVQIQPLLPPAAYWLDADDDSLELRSIPWLRDDETPAAPLLVVEKRSAASSGLSVMYLATTAESPIPSAEVRGLLLLQPAEIHRLVQQSFTLADYLCAGGRAILRETLPDDLPLEPFLQARALSRLLTLHQRWESALP